MPKTDTTLVIHTAQKRLYRQPELTRFGGFESLTLGGGGTKNDGGRVNTKA